MSHRNNDNNFWPILFLCLLFPEVAAGLGLLYILFWIVKIVFYALALCVYFIYSYPLVVIGVIGFFYFCSKKSPEVKKPVVEDKPVEKIISKPIDTPLVVIEDFLEDRDGVDDEEIFEIMENQGIDAEEAREIKDVMEEYDVDEDEATELKDLL